MPKIILGNQTAIIGEKFDCSAITPKTLSKKTYIIAITIPKAKFTPIPPRRLIDETETAIIVSI